MRRLAAWLCVVLLAGCAGTEKADLERYVHVDLKQIDGYERKLDDDAGGPHEMAHLCQAYVQALEQLRPATRAVRELHALKLKAARTRLAALNDFETALKHGDRSLGNRARDRFALARQQRKAYDARLAELEEADGVRP